MLKHSIFSTSKKFFTINSIIYETFSRRLFFFIILYSSLTPWTSSINNASFQGRIVNCALDATASGLAFVIAADWILARAHLWTGCALKPFAQNIILQALCCKWNIFKSKTKKLIMKKKLEHFHILKFNSFLNKNRS